MSGKYSRTYSRKKTAPPPISQFDKLLTSDSGSSTRPSVTKTAGHVGKWGVTSFTSLRNINGGLGRDESNKRTYPDDSPPLSSDDAFSFDSGASNGASLQVKTGGATFSKPRKFFKSRQADCVSEASKLPSASVSATTTTTTFPEKSRAKGGSDGCSSLKVPPSSSFETPDSSQISMKSSWEASSEVPMSNKVSLSKHNNSDASVTSSSKPSSGIKLKIFKSRNVASCSQETYSSTVELPSDDSRANSASTSVASSPSTKDFSEENRDSSEEFGPCASPQPQYKDSKIDIAAASTKATTLCSPDRLESPINRTLNSTFDSSFEYSGLVDQRTGLPVNMCVSDNDCSLPGNQTMCQTPQTSDSSSIKKPFGSKVSKSYELNKYLSKNMVSSAPSEIDSEQSLLGESVCDASLNDDFELKGFNVGSSDFGVPEPEKLPPVERGASPAVSSGGGGESDNIDLFSTDFDENEIEDRTSIDCSNLDSTALKDTNAIVDGPDMEDEFSAQGSYKMYKRSHSTKSESDTSKLHPPPPLLKKRSIFKSRNADQDAKKRATYKHKWHDQDEKEEAAKSEPSSAPSSQGYTASSTSEFDDFDFDTPATLKRVHTWPTTSSSSLNDSEEMQSVTSVKCAKQAKQYYTVVKNVKKTHQLQESGEFQEFNDDVEYFLDALRSTMPVSTRCLAALNLAQKCMVPAFRMHLRAHGTVIKFFNSLSDAHTDHKLAICAATVMFTLSQDRLNMDLDRDSLELMLNLLESDAESTTTLLAADKSMVEQNKKKIRELCRDMQKKGHAKHLNLDNINAGHLAMETLLSLTSKRAGEWFKEELRELGGVEHLIRTITQCTQVFTPELETWTPPLLEKLTKVDRCLKVLENVTHQNVANQEYLLNFQNGIFPEKLMNLYRLCHVEVPLYPVSEAHKHNTSMSGVSTGQLLVQALLTTLKVLINLTHNPGRDALGSRILGSQQEVYDITLSCLLIMPRYIAHDTKFELSILSCSLLLNLVEHSRNNRNILMDTKAPDFLDTDNDSIFRSKREKKSAMQALVELFYRCEESARQQEAHTDEIIDHDLVKQRQNEEEKKDDEIEETVARLLQKAGHHMEDTLIAAYTALLMGYCIMDDEDCETKIRAMLPDSKFTVMVAVLKKFLRFMDLTATTSLLRSLKPTEKVVKYMEKQDASADDEPEAEKKMEEEEESEVYAFGF